MSGRRILGAVLLASSLGAASAIAGTVDAGDYDAFWLWGGVAPQAVLARARTVYVLQGRVAASGPGDADVVLTAQGIDVPRLVGPAAWLVYRANTLHWPSSVYAALRGRLERWREAGNTVAGIQVDFDARASYLHEYAAFLRDLRRRLPPDCRLGVTGLLDWSTNADPDAINELARIVDEVVVQTYQGRRTIPDYGRYLPRLRRLTLPFRVGIIQGGDFDAPTYFRATPAFRGYVVFLQNP